MDDTKTQHLAELIQKSGTLTLSEKTEWLQLLSLMNDKQKSELERILTVPPVEKPTVVAGQPMNHIANLPKMGLPVAAQGLRSFSATASAAPQIARPAPAATAAILEKPNPVVQAPEKKPIPVSPAPQKTQVSGSAKASLPVAQVKTPPQTVVTEKLNKHTPLVVPTHEVSEIRAPQAPIKAMPVQGTQGSIAFKSLEDLSKLSTSQFRTMESTVLLESLMVLVKQSDYFQVKFALEQSPVYKTYISMGKLLLDGKLDFQSAQTQLQTSNKEYLSQLEFERFTDMLSSLQVN